MNTENTYLPKYLTAYHNFKLPFYFDFVNDQCWQMIGQIQSMSERRSMSGASWAPLAIFIEERELSAACDFQWRARVQRRSNFELKSIILQQNLADFFTF